jgi:PAS domain S-box-containing protein
VIAILRGALVAVAYAVVGAVTVFFSLHFAIPSPVFLSAGIAAGAVLAWGVRMAPAVFAGRLLLSLLSGGTFGPAPYTLLFELWLAVAVTLQAVAGGLLARRLLDADPGLKHDATAIRLVALVGPASCWVAPLLGIPALLLYGRIPPSDIAFTFYRWWASDSIGALLLAPAFLPLFAKPLDAWDGRRTAVLTSALVTALLLTTVLFTSAHAERRRMDGNFDTAARLQAEAVVKAINGIDNVALALDGLTRDTLVHTAAERALLVQVLRALVPEGVAVHWDEHVLGRDDELQASLRKAQAQQAVQRQLRLLPQPQIVWLLPGAGAVYLTAPLDALLEPLPGALQLQRCLMQSRDGAMARLAGGRDCEEAFGRRLQRDVPVSAGNATLTLRVTARPDYVAQNRAANTWVVYALALLGSAFLMAFIFTLSGRASRSRELVVDRTLALQSSEARLQNLFDAALVGVQYVAPDGRIERMNRECERILGCEDRTDAGALALLELVLPPQREAVAPLFAAVVRGDMEGWTRELTLQRCDGRPVEVLLRLAASRAADGQPRQLLAVLVDLTELRKLQAAERAREVAEAANRAKSDFVSRMSHELRTPLNAILGFTQLLRERFAREAAAVDQLGHVERAGWHLLAMVDDILDLSRLETGRFALDISTVPLARAVDDAVALVQDAARRRQLALEVETIDPALGVRADSTRLQQVLLNLLSNAVKYNRHAGKVRVRLRREPGAFGVAVEDTGTGLTPRQIEGLFEPFNRLGREKSATPGTGLGLVITRQLALAMDGRIDVRSEPGKGSVFTLWLPAAPEATVPRASAASAARGSGGLAGNLLYVEDNEVNVEVMRAVFAGEPGLRLQTCGTGAQALARVGEGGIDLVLLDLGLPDMDGHDLLRQLLRQEPAPQVIVVSADARSDIVAQVLDAGAFACLGKPFDIEKLRELVSRVLLGGGTS